jgi:hypothetical protein
VVPEKAARKFRPFPSYSQETGEMHGGGGGHERAFHTIIESNTRPSFSQVSLSESDGRVDGRGPGGNRSVNILQKENMS